MKRVYRVGLEQGNNVDSATLLVVAENLTAACNKAIKHAWATGVIKTKREPWRVTEVKETPEDVVT